MHHRDENKSNNELSNLLLLSSNAEHRQLHALLKQGKTEEEALALIRETAEQTAASAA